MAAESAASRRQHKLVNRLEQRGCNPLSALELLERIEDMQDEYLAMRNEFLIKRCAF
jgi:hypothetical protein